MADRDYRRREDDRDRKRRRDSPERQDVEAGGEVALSIEETNRLRISLGLKPLKLDSGPSEREKAAKRQQDDERRAQEQAKKAQDLRDKINERREKRKREELLAVRGLGEPDDPALDDAEEFIRRQKMATELRQEELRKQKQGQHSKKKEQSDSDGEYDAAQLANMKVRHNIDELADGEGVILTLADRGILDERGNLKEEDDDELENVLLAEDKKRKKARDAATKKATPLFQEDGKVRNLLDKYDEEDEQALLTLGADGMLEVDRQRQQEEMRKKLAEGIAIIGGDEPKPPSGTDYYTAEEMAAFTKPKKKKKERKIRQKTPEPEAGDTADLMAALEAQAAGDGDLGKRVDRGTARDRAAAEVSRMQDERRAKFDAALEKANWASQALKPVQVKKEDDDAPPDDDADNELAESLARARRVASQQRSNAPSLEEIAALAAKKREEEEANLKEEIKSGAILTDTIEFVRKFDNVNEPTSKADGMRSVPPPPPPDDDNYMGIGDDEDTDMKLAETVTAGAEAAAPVYGQWVSADEAARAEAVQRQRQQYRKKAEDMQKPKEPLELQDTGITGERAVGRGLGSVLALMKDKGDLRQSQDWAGRTNDRKAAAHDVLLAEVYKGGREEDRFARSVEVALTVKDELGRTMTPKERFRQLCYQFHGIKPSKNKIEHKMKKDAEEIALKKAATSENPSAELDRLRAVQQQSGTAYVVLSGKSHMPPPDLPRPRPPGNQTELGGRNTVPPPIPKPKKAGGPGLDGGLTPLVGDRKVEAMLGLQKPK